MMDVIREYGFKWSQLGEERSGGFAIGVLGRDKQALGWVISRQGEVWSAYQAPRLNKEMPVNPVTDGDLVGIYYNVHDAMEAVEAKCSQAIREAIERRRAANQVLQSELGNRSSAGPSS